jgi:hypothetical protein
MIFGVVELFESHVVSTSSNPLFLAVFEVANHPFTRRRIAFSRDYDSPRVYSSMTVSTGRHRVPMGVFTPILALDDTMKVQKVVIAFVTETAMPIDQLLDFLID